MWLRRLGVRDVRNLQSVELSLDPGLNVFSGRNAQGKTSLLEAAGLLARGRSFRTDQAREAIRHGAERLLVAGHVQRDGEAEPRLLEMEIGASGRLQRLEGREVAAAEYGGSLEVVVCSAERLRSLHGGMRARRQLLDRGAAALWPAYRRLLRDVERVSRQRSACLEQRRRDLAVWDEQLVETGARLRARRASYAARLVAGLDTSFMPAAETCAIELTHPDTDEATQRSRIVEELSGAREREWGAGRSLVGPQRDGIRFLVGGEEASQGASAGQARSLLLALTLSTLAVHRSERADSAVALLDDLDSELDDERSMRVCRRARELGQVLVTTAHTAWARRIGEAGRRFEVDEGRVSEAG